MLTRVAAYVLEIASRNEIAVELKLTCFLQASSKVQISKLRLIVCCKCQNRNIFPIL